MCPSFILTGSLVQYQDRNRPTSQPGAQMNNSMEQQLWLAKNQFSFSYWQWAGPLKMISFGRHQSLHSFVDRSLDVLKKLGVVRVRINFLLHNLKLKLANEPVLISKHRKLSNIVNKTLVVGSGMFYWSCDMPSNLNQITSNHVHKPNKSGD